jgi:hypothetical protein
VIAGGATDSHKSKDSKHAVHTASSLQKDGQLPFKQQVYSSMNTAILKYATATPIDQQTEDTMLNHLNQAVQAERRVGPKFTHSTRRLRLDGFNWGFAT